MLNVNYSVSKFLLALKHSEMYLLIFLSLDILECRLLIYRCTSLILLNLIRSFMKDNTKKSRNKINIISHKRL